MELYSKSLCVVLLSGYIKSMPIIMSDYSTRFSFTVSRKLFSENIGFQDYRVILSQEDGLRVLRFASLGMKVTVCGDLQLLEETEIFAERIDFDSFEDSGNSEKMSFILSSGRRESCLLH